MYFPKTTDGKPQMTLNTTVAYLGTLESVRAHEIYQVFQSTGDGGNFRYLLVDVAQDGSWEIPPNGWNEAIGAKEFAEFVGHDLV